MHVKGGSKLIVIAVLASAAAVILGGAWYLLRHDDSEKSEPDETSSIESLKSLPYVVWTPIEEKDLGKSGVTKHNSELSCEGINLYYTENKPGGHFFDMSGNVLHRFINKREQADNWQIIEPYHGNSFLVLIQTEAIFMIDWDSNIQWELRGGFHHDISVADNGDIYTLMHAKINVPEFSTTEPVRNDWLVIITRDGKIKKTISFVKMLLKNKELFEAAINREEKRYEFGIDAWDLFHSNSVELIVRDVFDGNKRVLKKGDVLVCIRHQNLIGAIDVEADEIVWHWGTYDLDSPHHASLLENNNILVFDNILHADYSRVIELNPATKEIEWEYKGDPPQTFRSPTRGSAQRLPNGNTLIAESDKGRVFEITRDGEIVWEFHNPEVGIFGNADTRQKEYRRATIYRMLRIIDPNRYPQLTGTKQTDE